MPQEVSQARPSVIPNMRSEVTMAEPIPACDGLTELMAVVLMGAITRPKPSPVVMVLMVTWFQSTAIGQRLIRKKPVAVKSSPSTPETAGDAPAQPAAQERADRNHS